MSIDLNELATAIGQIILRFRVRRRTAAEWTSANEILLSAELALETDTDKLKIGDGTTQWNDLAYFGGSELTSRNAGVGIDIEQHTPSSGTPYPVVSVDMLAGDGIFIDTVVPGASDDHWTDVSLLLHFDADPLIDSSLSDLAIATVGGALTSTDSNRKFGTASGLIVEGNGSWTIGTDAAFDFAADDWTIEGWFYPIPWTVGSTSFVPHWVTGLWDNYDGSSVSGSLVAPLAIIESEIYLTDSTGTTRHFNFYDSQYTSTSDSTPLSENPNPWTNNAWNHVAVVRSGTRLYCFVNGWMRADDSPNTGFPTNRSGVDIGTVTINPAPSTFYIGSDSGHGFQASGYHDEFRVTKGFARYTADFTVPSAAFYSSDTPAQLRISSSGGGTELTSRNAGTGIAITQFQPTTGGTGGNATDDTYFTDVIAVLHFEGSSGDHTSTDSGPRGLAVTQRLNSGGNYGGTIETTTAKFGTAAMTGRWEVANDPSMNLGTADWTLEGWCYSTHTSGFFDEALLSIGDNGAYNGSSSPNYKPEGVFIILSTSGLLTVSLTEADGTVISKQFAWDQKSGSTAPFAANTWTYWCVQRSGSSVMVFGGDRQLYINEFTEPGASSGVSGRYVWDIGTVAIKDTTEAMVIGGIPSDTFTDNSSWTFDGFIDEVRASAGVARRTSVATGVITVSTVADNAAPTSAFPGYGVPVANDGPPYPIISATGGGSGPTDYPLPPGCVGWFATSHRAGVSGAPALYLNAPMDYPGRGVYASQNPATWAASGAAAPGSVFVITPVLNLADHTFVAVIKTPAAQSGPGTVIAGGVGSLQFRLNTSGSNVFLELVDASVAVIGNDSSLSSLPASTLMLISATYSIAGGWTLRRSGTVSASGTTTSVAGGATTLIGAAATGETSQHELYEVAVFDRVLGSTDLDTAEAYLTAKYSL